MDYTLKILDFTDKYFTDIAENVKIFSSSNFLRCWFCGSSANHERLFFAVCSLSYVNPERYTH